MELGVSMCFLWLLPCRQLAWGGSTALGTNEMQAASSPQPLREGRLPGGTLLEPTWSPQPPDRAILAGLWSCQEVACPSYGWGRMLPPKRGHCSHHPVPRLAS